MDQQEKLAFEQWCKAHQKKDTPHTRVEWSEETSPGVPLTDLYVDLELYPTDMSEIIEVRKKRWKKDRPSFRRFCWNAIKYIYDLEPSDIAPKTQNLIMKSCEQMFLGTSSSGFNIFTAMHPDSPEGELGEFDSSLLKIISSDKATYNTQTYLAECYGASNCPHCAMEGGKNAKKMWSFLEMREYERIWYCPAHFKELDTNDEFIFMDDE